MARGMIGSFKRYLFRNRFGEILVHRGLLSVSQLQGALAEQKRSGRALGQILVEEGLISAREIRTTLALQSSLRMVAAVVTLSVSLFCFAPKPSFAGNLKDIPPSIALASVSLDQAQGIVHPALFGTSERRSADLSSFTKWSDMFERFQRDVVRNSTHEVVLEWKKDLAALRGRSLVQMADGVNNLMNRVRYIGDDRNWGKSDYWETPVEFLTRGGDCEDFAIAKYASLRALGVPESLLRISVVKDMQKGIPHAILIVYTEQGPMVLDNQIKQMTRASSIYHYKPIFSINRTAWWVHTNQGSGGATQIATASR